MAENTEAKANPKSKKRILPLLAILVCIALVLLLVFKILVPNSRYGEAQALYEAGRYEEAMAAYEALNGYKDSAAQAEKCRRELAYADALALYEAGQYEGAMAAFASLVGFRDSAAQIENCQNAIKDQAYSAALALRASAQYEEAILAFLALNGYRDSVEQIDLCKKDRAYDAAASLQAAGQYEEAIAAFEALNGYRDSAEQIDLCRKDMAYDHAAALQAAGRYEDAIAAFAALDGHRDSMERIEACNTAIKDMAYDAAAALFAAGRYEEAIAAFDALDGYRDSAAQIEACNTIIKDRAYDAAMTLYTSWRYEEAIVAFQALDGYRDSAAWVEICRRDMARWPNRPVNVVVPYSAGGTIDLRVRLLNKYFSKKTGQSFIINNITGGSGAAGYEYAYKTDPDGYNFFFTSSTIFTVELEGKLSYDWDDYEMVAFCNTPCNDFCIAVRADSPYQTILDLLDAAKADPYALTGGVAMTGQPRMIVNALQSAIGYDLHLTDVGYSYEGNTALLGGHVDWILSNCPACDSYVQSGDFRLLAVCGDERYPTDPDVPTFKEMGVDFSFPAQPLVWLAPKDTPAEVCEAFNRILREIYDDTDYQDDMTSELQSAVYHMYDVEESIRQAQAYKDALAPFIGSSASPSTSASEFKTLTAGAANDGETVRKVQQRLVDLHYLPYLEKDAEGKGIVTSFYGSACAKAVTKFQERNGLKETGKCDKETYDKLMSDDTTAYTMKEKDKLDIVRIVQVALIEKGYLKGNPTGYCGTDTVAAVKAFQKANGLTANGQADTETLQQLLGY